MRLRAALASVSMLAAVASCAAAPMDELPLDAGADARAAAPPPSTPSLAGPAVVIDPPSTPTDCPAGEYWVGRVRGRVVDWDGNPIAGAPVTVCGSICIGGESGADGRFEVRIDRCFTGSTEYAHGVAFGFDGLHQRTDVYFDFNAGNEPRMGVVRLERPIYVGTFAGAGYARAPMSAGGAMVVSDGLGFSLRVTPRDLEYPITAPEESVRVVRIPVSRLPAYTGAAPAVAYAISPTDTTLRQPAALEFPNVSGLRAGTVVEIVAVGNHASAGRPPVGVLDRIGTGRVSADGRRVVADTGLRFFGTVGYRVMR